MLEVDIVCPVYKNVDQISSLIDSLKFQKDIQINSMVFPLTLSGEPVDEEIKKVLNDKGVAYFEETTDTFSHSLTREKAIIKYTKSKLVVLISQDIKFVDEYAISRLASAIKDKVVYAFGRQICTNKSIEKYIRKKNYPEESYIVTPKDIEKMQLKAFFASDAFSCMDAFIFEKLNGYKGINTMMGEDMLYSKYILDAGYHKAYVADAVVEHSHKYTLKQLYRRYYDTGRFHAEIKVFDNYKTTDSGFKLAMYVLKQALKHFDIPVLFRWLPDMAARYLGMKKGRKSVK